MMMKNANPNLIAVGDNCLDAYLNKGFVTVGGNALNVAVQWKRLGYGARYFGALAPDQEADIMLGIIDDAGLARDDVEILQGKSAVTLLTDDAGERHFLLESLGVGENYIPDTQRYQELLLSDWTHLGTHSSEKLVRKLVQDGIGFSVDVSTRHFDLSLEGVPLVFASGPDDPKEPVEPLIARFKQAGAQKIVVTCGKRGSFYDNGSQLFSAGSVPVSVVDTCGAGDSFIATFLTAHFFEGYSEEAALRQAAIRASETCTHLGGFPQRVQPIPQWLLSKYDDVIATAQKV
ncbi:PfkB family carbohydrate kinase [Ochrobactrum teleogrylli]|uniref:PfkB family carbohydrate kinase n=2 Tax=Ochrobactrum TaxID=528 RepID=A0ABD5K079_9HYPH|nr:MULTISPECIES: PfkB family carbohydrate kinase [Brucella]WHS29991.1 PfkB family carbohydrate kinase [Brucella sp. NM4]WHT44521.1 PfkB family carbohydrate kinase [Ochrobactrum sp. SSR]